MMDGSSVDTENAAEREREAACEMPCEDRPQSQIGVHTLLSALAKSVICPASRPIRRLIAFVLAGTFFSSLLHSSLHSTQ